MPRMGRDTFVRLRLSGGSGSYILLPVLTTTQRDALSAEAGKLIYNSTTGQLENYDGSSWVAVGKVYSDATFLKLSGGTMTGNIVMGSGLTVDGVDVGAHGSRHQNGGLDELSVAGLSGELADDQPPKSHAADKHTDVTRTLFIPAAGMYTDGTLGEFGYGSAIQLADALTKIIAFTFAVPSDFVSFTKLELLWTANVTSGNMYWSASAAYAAGGQLYSTHTDSDGIGVSAYSGAAYTYQLSQTPTALALANLAVGDFVILEITRVGGHAYDTINATVYVFGLLFTYVASG